MSSKSGQKGVHNNFHGPPREMCEISSKVQMDTREIRPGSWDDTGEN